MDADVEAFEFLEAGKVLEGVIGVAARTSSFIPHRRGEEELTEFREVANAAEVVGSDQRSGEVGYGDTEVSLGEAIEFADGFGGGCGNNAAALAKDPFGDGAIRFLAECGEAKQECECETHVSGPRLRHRRSGTWIA